ncbi:MAG: preprotein translocase subunit YajC [Candidatus Dormibacteraceae bacterium]
MTALLAASSSKSSSGGGSSEFVIFLILIAVVAYFLLIRPQKQKQRRMRDQQSQVAVGDEVVTAGGIVGRVIAVDADRVTVLSGGDTVGFPAVGNEPTRLVLVRNAISRKIEPPIVSEPDLDGSFDQMSSEDELGDYGTENGANGAHGDDWGADAEGAENEGTSQ